MITDRIELHEVLLPINQNYVKIREINESSVKLFMNKNVTVDFYFSGTARANELRYLHNSARKALDVLSQLFTSMTSKLSERAADNQSRSRILL